MARVVGRQILDLDQPAFAVLWTILVVIGGLIGWSEADKEKRREVEARRRTSRRTRTR
jgi:hypothetical protein